jgi:hypothetical protein
VKRLVPCILLLIGLAGGANVAQAQSRPLVTEDPETVPAGNILVEGGLDFLHDAYFPASGLRGTLWRIATIGASFGVSSIAEFQLDGGVRNTLKISSRNPAAPLAHMLTLEDDDDSTGDFEDLRFGAKIRVANETEGRPAFALRFVTRLPNAGNESGLGLDTMDFHFGVLIGKTVRSIRFVGNGGMGILSDPERGDRQNDVVDYGFSVARAVATGVELVFDVNGRASTRSGTPPIGTESRSMMRFGARLTHRSVRIDGAFLVGITSNDPSWGVSTGVTWVVKAFSVQ